mgnify:CR=1 FL=1
MSKRYGIWVLATVVASLMLGTVGTVTAHAEALQWAVRAERAEYRLGANTDVIAWQGDAYVGNDELKLRYIGDGEYGMADKALDRFENQIVLQTPISRFFDGKAGIRYDAPKGPDRLYGTIGVQGLAPQWFAVDLDLFVSENGDASIRFDGDYEALITNRIILTPSLEFDLPFTDDRAIGVGAWGPRLETGLRLSYDLIDRMFSPYVGIHYERRFGKSADLARAGGGTAGAVLGVIGVRLKF